MKFSLHTILAPLLALPIALAALPAAAGPTKLADMPLMSLTGSGTVKPNLMIVYDDSGSMAYMSTPDYVDDADSCRGRAVITAENGVRACEAGHVPYHTPQFNRQYYNPQTRYLPPVDAAGKSYKSQNKDNTKDWKKVLTDGFSIDKKDFTGAKGDETNLVTGFPDKEWCRYGDTSDCKRNIAGYTYPDNTYTEPNTVYANPYYYTLNVNEYCTNNSLITCVSTGVNAPAPDTTYKEPALLRWCADKELTDCRAKNAKVDGKQYKYPRFGDPYRSPSWYTTITINDSGSNDTVVIDSVVAAGKAGSVDIMNGGITFNGGTNSADERNSLAAQLAKSIRAKSGLSRQFVTCLRKENLPVRACEATYGIILPADNMVAVIAVTCTGAGKETCTPVKEGERTGDVLTVNSPGATGLLQFSGTTANKTGNSRTRISNLKFAGQTLWPTGAYLDTKINAATAVASIAQSIGTGGIVKAYVGGNSVTPTCKAQNNATLCLIGPYVKDNATPSIQIANAGSLTVKAVTAVNTFVPTSVSGFDTGVFTRTDIVSTRDSYPKALTRTDCQGETCTYAEEMTNFANWYAYYKTRNQMMKTAVGHAIAPLDGDFKVGLVGLQRAASSEYADKTDVLLYPSVFDGDHRNLWYKTLYEMNANGGTPVRVALHEMGLMYANKGVFKQKKDEEVVKFGCQQNFTFVTTDGYWNGPSVSGVANVDKKEDETRYCTQKTGCVDPSSQDEPSLADVALYWFNGGTNENPEDPKAKSLNKDLEVADPMVPTSTGNMRLHMRTYALGLGVDGLMTYDPKYASDRTKLGDLDNIINQVQTGCPWTGGAYSWPDPQVKLVGLGDSIQARVDDLWHAAINGGGKYFAASDTQQVVDGLNEVINDITEATGAAASSATSTPNISLEDADIFSSTFTTVKWTGNLSKRVIDPLTGIVNPEVKWSSSWTLGDKVEANRDSRWIWYRTAGGERKNVTLDGLGETELAWFTDKCSAMTQCGNLSTADQKIVNTPGAIIGWLRGQQQYANGTMLRAYHKAGTAEIKPEGSAKVVVLGDIASSKPAYLRGARKSYPSADYIEYRDKEKGRKPTVFIAANDGMLHAFDAETGEEMWAYMPRITMKKLHLQASVGYGTKHQFTVDGSPELADVQIDGKWRTVLVAGLNAGGRGYYALDVTDPEDPQPLWEICADNTVCTDESYQPEIGLSFGNPQFGTLKDGKWVVFLTSGYNNVPKGDGLTVGSGKGFLFVVDIATGAQIRNLGEAEAMAEGTGLLTTGSGGIGSDAKDVENPSGFAKITAITENPHTDPLVTHVYGGDEFGQMWHFDFSGDKVKRVRMGSAGKDQPITTRPDVAQCLVNVEGVADAEGNKPTLSERRRTVAFGTGRLLAFEDIELKKLQALYVLSDDGKPVADENWRKTGFAEREFKEDVPYDVDDPAYDKNNPNKAQPDVFSISGDDVDLGAQSGWFVDFDQATGERVNLDPKIVSGTLSVITNVPQSSTACAVGGISYAYHLDLCSGKAVAKLIAGGLLSDSAAAVGFIIVRLPSGALKMITTTAKGDTITTEVNEANAKDARRTGWRRVRD